MGIVDEMAVMAQKVRLTPFGTIEREQLHHLARELVDLTEGPAPKPLGPVLERCPPAEKALVCVPAYDGRVNVEVMTSIFGSQGVEARFGIYAVSREVYVDRARNALVTDFLNTDATDMFFLDSDLGFDPAALGKVLRAERPFVAGVYPKKGNEESYPLDFLPGQTTSVDGLLEVAMVPTGFLRLHRSVFEAMPYVPYRDMGKDIKGYFKTQIVAGAFIGEDVAFCHLWRQLGGRIWIDDNITFQHIGLKTHQGNLREWILRTGKGALGDGSRSSGVQGGPVENSFAEGSGREAAWLRARRRDLGLEDSGGVPSGEEGQPAAA